MLKLHNLLLFSLIALSIIILVPSQNVFAAIPTVADAQGNGTEGGTTCEITVNVTADTTLIVVGANSDASLTGVADEDLQTYTSRVSETTSHFSQIWTSPDPATNAANTITVTGSSGDITCFALTLEGANSSAFGNTGSNSGTSGTTDTITYSTANDNSLIVHTGGDEWQNDITWDTGKTEQAEYLDSGGNKFGGAIATEGVASAGSNDGIFTWDRDGAEWSHAMLEVREGAVAYNENPSDNLSITDSITAHVTKSFSDSISITDSTNEIIGMTKTISDGLGVIDGHPIGNWGFESVLTDGSGHGNTLTATGGSSYPDGPVGTGYDLDGATVYLNGSTEGNFDFSKEDPFSVVLWVKRGTADSTEVWIAKKNANDVNPGWSLIQNANNVALFRLRESSQSNDVFSTAQIIDDSLWHLIVGTYDGTANRDGMTLYVDGVSYNSASQSITGDILNNEELYMGRYTNSGLPFTGDIDQVRIYPREISASEVATIYADENPYQQNSQSDQLSITDSVTATKLITNTESDPLSITDSITTTVIIINSESDPLSLIDSITSHITKFQSDPLSLTDSVNTMVTYTKSISDNLSLTDSHTKHITDIQSDPLSITDSVNTMVTYGNSESDPLSLTDSVTSHVIKFPSDPLSLTDSITATVTIINSESDPLSITDNITSHITTFPSDPLSLIDSVNTMVTYTKSISDNLSLTDSHLKHIITFPSDPLSITDDVTAECTGCGEYVNPESDDLSITDSVTSHITKVFSDPLSITDSVATTVTYTKSVSDSLSLIDSHTKHITEIQSDPLSLTDNMTPLCTGCGEQFDSESDPLSITDSVTATRMIINTQSDPISLVDSFTHVTTRNIPFVEEVDVGDDGAGNPDIGVDRSDSESDPLSITDSVTTILTAFYNVIDDLSITDMITAINGTAIHFINVTEAVNVSDMVTDIGIFVYEPTGKVIWFKVADPTNSTKGGVFSSMCDSAEVVTGINGTGYVKCTVLQGPTTITRGGVYEADCPGGEYVSGIDSNGDLVCSTP